MKAILINYEFVPEWLKDSGLDYEIWDRSETQGLLDGFPADRLRKTENRGNVDYDKLTWIVENYDALPDVFLWGKTNLFKYVTPERFEEVKNAKEFVPLLKYDHPEVMCDWAPSIPFSFYQDGIYHDLNNSWYLNVVPAYRYRTYGEFAKDFLLPSPAYLPFAPGGNYILTRAVVHRYGRDFYDKMRSILPYCQLPGEAQMLERTYYTLWK